MTITDRRSTILFHADCMKIAELHFTGDYGRVLVVNPNCVSIHNPRYWSGLDIVRQEYRRDFDMILSKWSIDRITFQKRA